MALNVVRAILDERARCILPRIDESDGTVDSDGITEDEVEDPAPGTAKEANGHCEDDVDWGPAGDEEQWANARKTIADAIETARQNAKGSLPEIRFHADNLNCAHELNALGGEALDNLSVVIMTPHTATMTMRFAGGIGAEDGEDGRTRRAKLTAK